MHGFRIGPRHRAIAYALVIAMVLALVPEFKITLPVHAAAEFTSGAVYIDSRYDGQTIYIKDGVFSVTVNGATDVNLIFGERTESGAVGVTIDRRHVSNTKPNPDAPGVYDDATGTKVDGLYKVSENLGATGVAQTCPLLITGNSTVTATFHGVCRFYAGTNACGVDGDDIYTARTGGDNNRRGNGFAGIQVDSGSSLTIDGADDLMVFGGHQFGIPTIDSDGDGKADSLMYSHSTGTRQFVYSDILRAHKTITVNINGQNTTIYTNPSTIADYDAPTYAEQHNYSGGAGIGGGPTLVRGSTGQASFTNGVPGNIIINGGNIEAFGGHQAAGIGGAVNSAATTGMIQINGGKVIAHGGRWAAGIGDGDTVTSPNTSNSFRDAVSLIEINGGSVTSYGGVASSGIGTSDEISHSKGFGTDFIRQLQINLNGGTIRAFSGFPQSFTGSNYPDDAPAAIGAGSLTITPANSLHVAADADLRCAGFGNFALTENGQEANAVPNISVDSDGYLLLLRTGVDNNDSYHSTATRTLTLYTPVTVPFLGEEGWTVYVDQNNKTALTRYLVSPSGTVYAEDKTGGSESAFGTKWSPVAEGQLPTTLTLYINDKSSAKSDPNFPYSTALETIEMAYFFRSIALTLPHPDEYGGLYALGVPMDGVRNSNLPSSNFFDQIALTVEAKNQGTQSGWIDFPSGSNMGKDNTAAPLTRLDVNDSAANLGPGTPGMIGDSFKSGVYAYTVYVEPGTENVDLYLTFDQRKNDDNVTNVHHKIVLDSPRNSNEVLRDNTNGATEFLVENLTLSGEETVVRIKKTDANNPLGTISYKVTIIVKGDYRLTISASDKTYDGRPADVSATGVGGIQHVVEPIDHPTSSAVSTVQKNSESPTPVSTFSRVFLRRSWNNRYTYHVANLNYKLVVQPVAGSANDEIRYILTVEKPTQHSGTVTVPTGNPLVIVWTMSKSGSTYSPPTLLTDDLSGSDYTDYTQIKTTGTTELASSDTTVLYLSVNAGSASLLVGDTEVVNILSLSTAKTSVTESTGTSKEEALGDARVAIKKGTTSGRYEYGGSEETVCRQQITVNRVQWSNTNGNPDPTNVSSEAYELYETSTTYDTGYYEIVAGDKFVTISGTEADLEQVQFTYYKLTLDEDNHVTAQTKLNQQDLDPYDRPKDAGVYRVEATLVTTTYNASTPEEDLNAANTLEELAELETVFIIKQRPLKVLRIENWLVYVDKVPALGMDNVFQTDGSLAMLIPDPGYIELDDVIQEDEEQVKFVLPNTTDYPTLPEGKAYYDDPDSNTLAVDYRSDKIVLANGILAGGQAHNYCLDYTDPSMIRVYGQISYEANGAIFRKDDTDAPWHKYYPDPESKIPVGTDPGEIAPDYHSPATGEVYLTHAEYIRARTVNEGSDEARYCIDIEYGAMSFGFFRSIWDVSELDYDETDTSHWTGMDGSNNKLTIVNYSNRPVEYTLSLTRDAQFGGKIDFAIKTANVTTGGNSLISMTGTTMSAESGKYAVAAATAGSGVGASGEEARTSSYVILSGVPQFAEGINPSVGTIGISFSPASDDS